MIELFHRKSFTRPAAIRGQPKDLSFFNRNFLHTSGKQLPDLEHSRIQHRLRGGVEIQPLFRPMVHYGRYTCVNLTNTETVEIRIFRGTLKYNTFIATLQLVNRLCDVAIYLTDSELHAMSWSDFTAGITEPELIQYLKERRLYLNEPVESEVEL